MNSYLLAETGSAGSWVILAILVVALVVMLVDFSFHRSVREGDLSLF